MKRHPLFVWDFFGVLTEDTLGAGLVMEKVREVGGKNIILSNTYPSAIEEFLKREKLSDKVDKLISAIGQSKTVLLREYLANQNPSKIVVVGDSLEEMEAGEAVGAITYSFRNESLSQKADFVIKNLTDLLEEAKE